VNVVQEFLVANSERLRLEHHGLKGIPSCVVLTPRFPASRHIVVLVLAPGAAAPCLVVKLPRLPGDHSGVAREAASLQELEQLRHDLGTAPRVVSFERMGGLAILLQTALVGEPIDQDAVRKAPTRCVAAVTEWLAGLPQIAGADRRPDWFEDLLARPLERLAAALSGSAEGSRLLERTAKLVEPLRGATFPLVFEHGDLSDPNLLWLEDGRVGVVDWELSQPRGLPLHDLCFFLAYVAVATARATTLDAQVTAFSDAFLARDGWARPLLAAAAEQAGLAAELRMPLFVACWMRCTAGLLQRFDHDLGNAPKADGHPLLLGDRCYAFWRQAVAHADAPGGPWDH
jgi:aminoglycoside phosphotransferase (APT) family kinase protein